MRRLGTIFVALAVVGLGLGCGKSAHGVAATRSTAAAASTPTSTPTILTSATTTPAAAIKHKSKKTHHALGLHVAGNQFVNSKGHFVRLIGFNNSGAEYSCVRGSGIFDVHTATDLAVPKHIVDAMSQWKGANVVRVPLDEQCWLGIGGVDPQYSGAAYQKAILNYVHRLNNHKFAVILDLHRSAPGDESSTDQEPMPDQNSIQFWTEVATVFGTNTSVLFDLFNEPWPDAASRTPEAWACWRDGGCTVSSQNAANTAYAAVGMNQLIATVRATGAQNVVLAGGVDFGSAINHWLDYEPTDPANNLAAADHLYSYGHCATLTCYNEAPSTVSAQVPLVLGEFGPDLTVPFSSNLSQNCTSSDVGDTGFDSTLLGWANDHDVSWLAWTWNPWGNCYALITDFSGTPTSPYGAFVKSALRANRQHYKA